MARPLARGQHGDADDQPGGHALFGFAVLLVFAVGSALAVLRRRRHRRLRRAEPLGR